MIKCQEGDQELLLKVIDYSIHHPTAVPGYLQVMDLLSRDYMRPSLASAYIRWIDGEMPTNKVFTPEVRAKQAILDEVSA